MARSAAEVAPLATAGRLATVGAWGENRGFRV